MDYRLTDAIADPPGESDSLHTEKLIRLPHGFLCYQPSQTESPPVSPLPSAVSGAITFVSFNVLAKLTAPAIALWSRILDAVPRSRLILKNHSLADPEVKELIAGAFAQNGVPRDRLELLRPAVSVTEHLSLYAQADIALDTFPYNGTTTTCEALWMGVPVITYTGDTHAARVGASILNQIGLPELIGASPEDYLRRAVELANDPARLAAMRAEMRDRLARSPLLDAAKITADIESAYQTMMLTSISR
jgi:predicted O-linked N-acetylglucosamine transferase (SPINDLY family)